MKNSNQITELNLSMDAVYNRERERNAELAKEDRKYKILAGIAGFIIMGMIILITLDSLKLI